MKILIALAAIATLSACGSSPPSPVTHESSTGLEYFMDEETQLCFVTNGFYRSSQAFSMTIVPCTEKVMKFVKGVPR